MAKSNEEQVTKIIKKSNCSHIFYLSGIASVTKSNIYRKKNNFNKYKLFNRYTGVLQKD